jgi:hypothetical protein
VKVPILDHVLEGPFGQKTRERLQDTLKVHCPELETYLRSKFFGLGVKTNTRAEMGKYALQWLDKERPDMSSYDRYEATQSATTAALKPDFHEEVYRQQMSEVVTNHQIHVQDKTLKGDLGRRGLLQTKRTLPHIKNAEP